jgi:hypothetical protein
MFSALAAADGLVPGRPMMARNAGTIDGERQQVAGLKSFQGAAPVKPRGASASFWLVVWSKIDQNKSFDT